MSYKYRKPQDVPTDILCNRLNELSNMIRHSKGETRGRLEVYSFSIPEEVDKDGYIVIKEAAVRLKSLNKGITEKMVEKKSLWIMEQNHGTAVSYSDVLEALRQLGVFKT